MLLARRVWIGGDHGSISPLNGSAVPRCFSVTQPICVIIIFDVPSACCCPPRYTSRVIFVFMNFQLAAEHAITSECLLLLLLFVSVRE